MFSLIITISSIALVVALIAATMYYGADTLTRGQAAADAAAIISGGEQVIAAITAFNATTGRYPNNLEELLTRDYLTSFPDLAHAGFEIISSAHAAPVDGYGDWLYDHDTPHLAYVGIVSMDTCAEVNSQISQRRVVLNRIDPDPRAQCVVKGAQDPVVVFRHPGEKEFTGWDDHPRIPAPIPGGAFNQPDYAGACVYGCDDGEAEGGAGDSGGDGAADGDEIVKGTSVQFITQTPDNFAFANYNQTYGVHDSWFNADQDPSWPCKELSAGLNYSPLLGGGGEWGNDQLVVDGEVVSLASWNAAYFEGFTLTVAYERLTQGSEPHSDSYFGMYQGNTWVPVTSPATSGTMTFDMVQSTGSSFTFFGAGSIGLCNGGGSWSTTPEGGTWAVTYTLKGPGGGQDSFTQVIYYAGY